MKVVVMRVRDEDGVDATDDRAADPVAVSMQRSDPILEQRIRHYTRAVDLEEHRRVPEEANLRRHQGSVVRGR